MRAAISRSCDVYFYRMAERMGIDRMHEFMSTFGYGELTGIDIPGRESRPICLAGMEAQGVQAQGRPGVVPR